MQQWVKGALRRENLPLDFNEHTSARHPQAPLRNIYSVYY